MSHDKWRRLSNTSKSILASFGFDWFAAANATVAAFAIYQQARTT
jgi:hypothetical protein